MFYRGISEYFHFIFAFLFLFLHRLGTLNYSKSLALALLCCWKLLPSLPAAILWRAVFGLPRVCLVGCERVANSCILVLSSLHPFVLSFFHSVNSSLYPPTTPTSTTTAFYHKNRAHEINLDSQTAAHPPHRQRHRRPRQTR